jgi:dTDP-4-amino-4,6-dideoxygalactose transaminase
MRHVPPVVTAQPAEAWRAAWRAIGDDGGRAQAALADALRALTGMVPVALTDSGTSALRLALDTIGARGGLVAVPGFGCVDVATAVQGAGMRAVPYDLDADSFVPVASSLAQALSMGARVVIASHYFGQRVALGDVRAQCDAAGATLIEDAAQAAGAVCLPDAPPVGPLMVMSFGRGKGLGGAGGGALLADAPMAAAFAWAGPATHANRTSELRTLLVNGAAWMLARPSWYGIPSRLPFLHLGEMIYHPPVAPAAISQVSAAFACAGVRSARAAAESRAIRGRRLAQAARAGMRGVPLVPTNDRESRWLRLPLRLTNRTDTVPASLGVYRAYPEPVPQQAGTRDIMVGGSALPGATTLAACVVTLPVHDRMDEQDVRALERWLGGADA